MLHATAGEFHYLDSITEGGSRARAKALRHGGKRFTHSQQLLQIRQAQPHLSSRPAVLTLLAGPIGRFLLAMLDPM